MDLTWDILRDLEEKHGDRFYLLDPVHFCANYADLLQAFRLWYPHTRIAYSYKTNYEPWILRAVSRMGGYAEVVSGKEWHLAADAVKLLNEIVLAGPCKTPHDIMRVLMAGGLVILENYSDVEALKKLRSSQRRVIPGKPGRVGIRANFDIGLPGRSRFGFDVDGDPFAFSNLVDRIRRLKGVVLGGFHCHFYHPQRSANSYLLRIRKLLDLSQQFFPDQPPQFINVGGGFASRLPSLLERQLGSLPTFKEYATVIGGSVTSQYPGGEPELIIEPGMALVADTMRFVCKVTDISEVSNEAFIQTTGSVYNIKPSRHNVVLPCTVVRAPQSSPRKPWTLNGKVVGYTCQEDDVLFEELPGPVGVDDYLVVDNVGAYTTSMFPSFIQDMPPVILYTDKEVNEWPVPDSFSQRG